MSLSLYKKKRNFSDTPEPEGNPKKSKGSLRFVIQKHKASHLHYDFRLEIEGVLKSWAVPKGPSLNPKDKRLAMMVEDHPYDYKNFEGNIPEGNYGAGTVMVWDEGTYEPVGLEDAKKLEQEKTLLAQLKEGNIKFRMYGSKLKGNYALLKMKNGGDKAWMLIKKKDEFALDNDITHQDTSVLTERTIEQIESNSTTVKKSGTAKSKNKKEANPVTKQNPSNEKAVDTADISITPGATKTPLPKKVKPMLATLVDNPFDSKDWLFEIKWDGYRAVAYVQDGKVDIISRNNKSFANKYSTVKQALEKLSINAVLDGEIVAVDEKGLAVFQLLQNWQNNPQVRLQYYVFDILWLNGYNLINLPLIERKRILKEIVPQNDEVLKYSDHVVEKGNDFFKVALQQGLEGIMAKKCSSLYKIAERSNEWLKIKVARRQEVIIAGYTMPRRTRKFFGALLLGVYEGDELIYIGHSGSGFDVKSLEMIWKKLQPLITPNSPFATTPKTNMPATWVQPKLVCEIKFTEWTKDKHARHPIFMGLREDKNPKDVKIEKISTMPPAKTSRPDEEKSSVKEQADGSKASKKTTPKKRKASSVQLSLEGGADQAITISNEELKVTNLSKIYWKKEGIAKMDMINYYLKIVPFIMPYIINRPQSLHRFPNGITGAHFFQKDVRGKVPAWAQTFEFYSESTDEKIEYLVCKDEATLIYMANLGCIEIHPWHSKTNTPENPDYCLIDLDPDKNSYNQVVEVAQVVKKILDAIDVPCYPKTSGSTGMHIYIPLGGQYNYEQSKQLAELIVTIVNKEVPALTSLERNPDKRKGKIYLDFLQNNLSQTVAAPYSLRPKPGAPVSTPLHWDEVKKGLTAATYHMHNIFERLKTEGDLFKPVLEKGINLVQVLKKIELQFPQ